MANKYTPQAERAALISVSAVWTGVGAVPDSVDVGAAFSRQLIHDDTPSDVITLSSGSITVNGMRTDRSVQVGAGPTLTYRQCSLYLLQMIAHMRANPE
jgi:hypothetical protein